MAQVNKMHDHALQQLLEETGAILKGHFLLTSGRHSDTYFEKFRALERPEVLTRLCYKIAHTFKNEIDVVVGPTTGGIIVAFETARQLGCLALYVETEDGQKRLRRGGTIAPGSRVLVVDDVLTTGRSVLEVVELMKSHEVDLRGVAVLIDRSESPIDFGTKFFAAHRVEASSYPADLVPDWLAAIPISKPGTRKEAGIADNRSQG